MTLATNEIDRPEVLAELRTVFDDYEHALMSNDVAALNAFFWDDPRTTRYGIADRQWGMAEIAAYRAATPAPTFSRELRHPRLTALGADMGVAQVEFLPSNTTMRGFQTQTWVRMDGGWKIVCAHVSLIPFAE